MEHTEYRKYIEGLPDIDSPEISGLHPNADLTFRVKEAGDLFKTLGETQRFHSILGGFIPY